MSDIFTKKDWIYRCAQSFPLSLCSQNSRRKEKWCQVARKSLPHEKNKLKWHFPSGVLKSLMKTARGKSSARPVPFPSWCGMGEGVELVPLQKIQERTIKVTVPFVRLRMATASSWVTPSRLCPLTAMIWSPLLRRPSSEAAPCNYKVGLFASQKMLPRSYTTEKDLNKNVNCSACTHTLLSVLPGCSQPLSNDEQTQRRSCS